MTSGEQFRCFLRQYLELRHVAPWFEHLVSVDMARRLNAAGGLASPYFYPRYINNKLWDAEA